MNTAADGTASASQRVAIVTGAGQGLGRAIAERLLREGVAVLASDKAAEGLHSLRASHPQAPLQLLQQDVTAEAAPQQAVDAALQAFGAVHYLVNNAGIGRATSVSATTDADWDRFMDVNLRSAFRFARAVLAVMHQRPAAIVNIASTLGLLGSVNNAGYSASKAALIGLTRQMAADYGPKGIRVNAVAPGLIETPLTLERIRTDTRFRRLIIDTTPFPRVGLPEDVANAVWFLCSEQASFISGHTLVVDGGWSVANYLPEE